MNHSIKRFFLTILLCTVALPLVAQTQSLPRAKASAKMDVAFEEYLKAAADAKPGFVPEDIDTPVAASKQPTVKNADMADIDEIFSIFKR